jgi:hypothetical protein
LLLENARRKTIRIWAQQAPFDVKDELKKRGYRWSSGDEGRPKAWYVDLNEAKRADEIAFLRQLIYLREVDCSFKLCQRSIDFRSEFGGQSSPNSPKTRSGAQFINHQSGSALVYQTA